MSVVVVMLTMIQKSGLRFVTLTTSCICCFSFSAMPTSAHSDDDLPSSAPSDDDDDWQKGWRWLRRRWIADYNRFHISNMYVFIMISNVCTRSSGFLHEFCRNSPSAVITAVERGVYLSPDRNPDWMPDKLVGYVVESVWLSSEWAECCRDPKNFDNCYNFVQLILKKIIKKKDSLCWLLVIRISNNNPRRYDCFVWPLPSVTACSLLPPNVCMYDHSFRHVNMAFEWWILLCGDFCLLTTFVSCLDYCVA